MNFLFLCYFANLGTEFSCRAGIFMDSQSLAHCVMPRTCRNYCQGLNREPHETFPSLPSQTSGMWKYSQVQPCIQTRWSRLPILMPMSIPMPMPNANAKCQCQMPNANARLSARVRASVQIICNAAETPPSPPLLPFSVKICVNTNINNILFLTLDQTYQRHLPKFCISRKR